jgi:hypothetical protein
MAHHTPLVCIRLCRLNTGQQSTCYCYATLFSSIQASTMTVPCCLSTWYQRLVLYFGGPIACFAGVPHQHPSWTEPIAALTALLNTSQQQSKCCSKVLYSYLLESVLPPYPSCLYPRHRCQVDLGMIRLTESLR